MGETASDEGRRRSRAWDEMTAFHFLRVQPKKLLIPRRVKSSISMEPIIDKLVFPAATSANKIQIFDEQSFQ